MPIRTYELGKLFTQLPKDGEFKAGNFASNSDEARLVGKMLTELKLGVQRIESTLRIDDRKDKPRTMEDKIEAVKSYIKK